MKAIGFTTAGGIDREDALIDLDVPAPTPRPRDLLVRVKAISVNPVDTKIRANAQPPAGEARILGYDAAGVVEAVGSDVTLFRPGDEVFYAGDVNRPGTYAELHLVDERIVGRKPKTLDWAQAAALPLTAITAWELLFDRLRVPYGRKERAGSLLIVNGAGGVGSILIQLARRLTGCTIIATASRPETIDWVRELGAHHIIDHHKPLDEELHRIGVPQVDYVASLTADDRHFALYPKIIVPEGCLALIANPKTLDMAGFMRKSITLAWELMFTRSTFESPNMVEQHRLLEEIADLVDAGVLRTTLTQTMTPINAANLRAVHKAVECGRTKGKIVLVGF